MDETGHWHEPMQHTDISRKQRSNWPWLAGLVVLGLLGWGVTTLLSADEPNGSPPETADSAADVTLPAEIPMAPRAAYQGSSSPSLAEFAPLDGRAEHKQAHASGKVVATGSGVFWLLSGSRIIRVDSPHHVRRGQTVTAEGTLESTDPERTNEIAAAVLARDPEARQSTLVRTLKLVADPGGVRTATGEEAAAAARPDSPDSPG